MGVLYHGSSIEGIKRIEPHASTHGTYVYATPDRNLAIIFSGRYGDDLTYSLFRNDNHQPWQLVERIPFAFETMFSNASSIYTVSNETFKDINTGFLELVSEVGVDTTSETRIECVLDALKLLEESGEVQMYSFDNKPNSISQDDTDLLDKEIEWALKAPSIVRDRFKRLLLLHPNLLEKLNQKFCELNLDFEPFSKEELVDIYRDASIIQESRPDKEFYLKSAKEAISRLYPEFKQALAEIDNSYNKKI